MNTQQPVAKYRLDYQRPSFTITDVHLDFNLEPNLTTVTAVSQIVYQSENGQSSLTPLFLDGENLKLISIQINNQSWTDYQLVDNGMILNNLPERFQLTIVNEIKPIENTTLQGLYVSGDALCTQCEAEGFRHITYYLDRPDVLARFTVKITANKNDYPYLLSNGNRILQGELADNKHWVQWQDPFPKPAYLFALVAGHFDVLKDRFITHSNRCVDLEIYVDKGNLDRADWAMTCLKNAMKWDEQRFGLEYDLDIYMLVAVDFFNMGAMENKGLNVFNSKFVLAKKETATDEDYLNIEAVIGHEYFHNWTGNRITCRDWFQLSLKEGLTVFRDQEFSSDLGSRAVNRINNVRVMRSAQFAEDASPMAHPIRPDKVIEMNNFYTLTVYEKGAEVIRMMHTLLGEEKFQAGMQLYVERYDGQAVTCDDFIDVMESASKINLSQFRRWYSQSGTPELTVTDDYDENNQKYSLTVKQYTPPTQDQKEKLALHILLDIELYNKNGEVIPLLSKGKKIDHVLNITEMEQTFVFEQITEKPIVSLLREFSAPVKLHYEYSDHELAFLMQNATNEFSRYDAGQQLLAKYIRLNIQNVQRNNTLILPEIVIDAFKGVLLSNKFDPWLIAQMITLPTENEMATLSENIDPDAIYQVRQYLLTQFASAMSDELLAVYFNHLTPVYRIEHQDMAKRALKNRCLSYLAFHPDCVFINELITKQYQQSDNMTDTIAALSAAVGGELSSANELMKDFENKWQHDGLVMDKWFSLQATQAPHLALARVNQLLSHPSFSLSNPNRVRGLIGAFVMNNPVSFHNIDGSGYQFLVNILKELNDINPQVAARLIDPLIRFKNYDEKRQQLMVNSLQELLTISSLSTDLYEKITSALAEKSF